MENIQDILQRAESLPSGNKVLVTTPHPVTLGDEEKSFVIQTSGLLVNASPVEEVVFSENGVTFVTTVFQGNEKTRSLLEALHEECPGLVILGSIIAAQAYPGLVMGLVPVKGFERVPPDQKRMCYDKFTIFRS
jgi:hypothetical protein